ncbi:YodC family protein [Acinetobacter modestus]|uniref:YodC family protein n=1 Tax=Acinetobacter TaxID=469 RepID=UPI00301A55E7
MDKFIQGDVVYLKSGGPAMTVEEAHDDKSSYCVWFDKKQDYNGEVFQNKMLTKEKPIV